MKTMQELTEYVLGKASQYLKETGEENVVFPLSVVDFVIEYVIEGCHFPGYFTEERIVSELKRGKNTMAMACVDIYSKVGAEGQKSHSENSVSRTYESAWITFDLLSHFPNYVGILSN